ncbi:MAG: hypothetical protein U0930_07805 [Pirellulales bacterium]
MLINRISSYVLCLLLLALTSPFTWAQSKPMNIEIDARDLPRKLLSAIISIPIENSAEHVMPLWYPKWVPGSHGPGGPIANVAGLSFADQAGRTLEWTRTAGEVYRFEVKVPASTTEVKATIRYITNQPTTNSMGHDSFGASQVGIISPSTVLLYRESDNCDEQKIDTKLWLPRGWQAASALKVQAKSKRRGSSESTDSVQYISTSLQNFVDSPIMCGLYYRAYEFDTTKATPAAPISPHVLHVFSEQATAVNLDNSVVESLQKMVVQASKMTGSQPFDHFDILLAVTDQLSANGLEHSRSTLNVLPINSVRSAASMKGWYRLLIPHEYMHSWCGKYRRPAGMVTNNFHTAKGTELLWVYEGLTQYLGEVIEARCGLMNKDEFSDRFGVELRNAVHQQNRQWRPLADTAAASHVLRDSSSFWPKLRGSQDYYMEGMLFWIEADAIIRSQSGGLRSLDDFCKAHFACPEPTATALSCVPKGYTRQEIVETLDSISKYDWDGLIRRRVESTRESFDPVVAEMLGYSFKATTSRPSVSPGTFRFPSGIDHMDTLGLMLGGDGSVNDIRLGGPADRAKLGPGMKVVAIGDRKWSRDLLEEAVQKSTNSAPIDLLVEDGSQLRRFQIQYFDGPRYLSLTRDESKPDLLEKILKPQ